MDATPLMNHKTLMTEARANGLAWKFDHDADDDWTYRAQQHGRYWIVMVYDEDGLEVGSL